jgi:hypothetical protein
MMLIYHEYPKNAAKRLHFIKRLDNRIWWAMVQDFPEGWATDNVIIKKWQGVLESERTIHHNADLMHLIRPPFGAFFAPYEYQLLWDLGQEEYPGSIVQEMRKDFDTW